MSIESEFSRLYPGHLEPELSLFVRDAKAKTISNNPSLVAAGKSSNGASIISNAECLAILDREVPAGAFQLIRFRAKFPDKNNPSPTRHVEAKAVISVFEKLQFPISTILLARRSSRIEVGRLLGYTGDSDERPVFYVSGSRLCLVWAHDMKSHSTRAILINFVPTELQNSIYFVEGVGQALQLYSACFSHSMLITLVLAKFLTDEVMVAYTSDSKILRHIEYKVTVKSSNRIETMQRLRDLGRIAIKDRFMLAAIRKVLDLALQVEEYYPQDQMTVEEKTQSRAFRWHQRQLQMTLDLNTSFLESISESVANQQAAISGIINMQDGASMKTVAFITMAFLPGTFVASFFAMPMFHWNGASNQIVSRQFWIYWAVTVPLTGSIFLVWLGWWYWHNVRKEYDDPQSGPFKDAWIWLENVLAGDGKDANGKRSSVSHEHWKPLQADAMREYEDGFYDFDEDEEEEDAARSSKSKSGLKRESV